MSYFIIGLVAYGIFRYCTCGPEQVEGQEKQKKALRPFKVGTDNSIEANGIELTVETKDKQGVKVALFQKEEAMGADGRPFTAFCLFSAQKVGSKK